MREKKEGLRKSDFGSANGGRDEGRKKGGRERGESQKVEKEVFRSQAGLGAGFVKEEPEVTKKRRENMLRMVSLRGEGAAIILDSLPAGIFRGGDAIPPGTFHGGDAIPRGTFHGGDAIPPGTFH
ncbi:MAG: hypothetical protein SCM96_15815 [Acidobacteriota bacterium]|nr:hypothetical protein [Acidobacteriota bacterium]